MRSARLKLASGPRRAGLVRPPGSRGVQPRSYRSDASIKVTRQAKSEKRRLKRTVRRIPATFVSGATHGNGHIKNLSQEGLFLRTDRLPAKGDLVSVVFYVLDGSKIEVFGTVRWTTAQVAVSEDVKPGFGMDIDQRNDAYLQFYEHLLTH